MDIDGGSDLLPVGFVRRLQHGLADAEGEGEIWLQPPGVLQEVFEFIRLVMAVHECPVSQKIAGCSIAGHSVVELTRDGRDNPAECGDGDVVGIGEARIHARISEGCRIETATGIRDAAAARDPVFIGAGVVDSWMHRSCDC